MPSGTKYRTTESDGQVELPLDGAAIVSFVSGDTEKFSLSHVEFLSNWMHIDVG